MSVELRPAFSWDCPSCDQENFARAIVAEFAPEDIKELKEEFGFNSWDQGDFLMQPKKVTCCNCQESFESVEYSRDGEI